MSEKVALITGITGQDGSYLTDLLLEKGYHVHGLIRPSSRNNRHGLEEKMKEAGRQGKVLNLHTGDIGDMNRLLDLFNRIRPDEVYNLAAKSHVMDSYESPLPTIEVDGTGVLRLLDAIRLCKLATRFYQASSAELYGKTMESPQNESTPFKPGSPYAVAKLYGFWIVKNYREAHGMHASNGILFNHESPRRGENFVTRKITLSLARIKAGTQETLRLGNMDAMRDWGFAGDFVEMMWLMLQHPQADDYVIATGEAHTVREFIEKAAPYAGFEVEWEGSGLAEIGRDKGTGKVLVEIDSRFYRPLGGASLLGNPEKAETVLGWRPKVKFEKLVGMMMRADLESISGPKSP